QAIVVTLRPAEFDRYIAALDVVGFAEAARNAAMRAAESSGDRLPRNQITGIVGCCARAASRQVTAAPPMSVMNLRRVLIRSPRQRWQASPGGMVRPSVLTVSMLMTNSNLVGSRPRFTEEQIIGILREQEAGAKTVDVCRKHGVSSATFYKWK